MKFQKCYLLFFLLFFTLGWANNWHGAAIAPDGRNAWVVTIDTGLVLHTPNCCTTWVDQSFPTPRYFWDVFSLNNQKVWIGTDQGFIFYTENGGNDWTQQASGLSKHVARIFFFDDSCGWAACGKPIIGRTIDGGQGWAQIFLPPIFPMDTVDFYGVHFVNRLKGWVCAGRYPEYIESIPGVGDTWFTRGQGYIAKSTDGGDNWQLQRRDTVYDFFDIRFKDALNGYVVGGNDRTNVGVIMKTTDGGQNWQSVTIPTQAKILRALENVGNHWWAVGRNGTIIHSSDNGNKWTNQQSNVDTTLFDVDFADTLHGLVSGNGCVLYTNNGGDTWQIANIEGIQEININLLSNSKCKIIAFPNPFHYHVTFQKPVEHTLQIYSVVGNLIRVFNSGTSTVTWNGKDNYGRLVPAGVYFAMMKNSNNLTVTPIVYQK